MWLGLLGSRSTREQRWLTSWFGIRGIGSIYYLMYAINHGLEPVLAEQLIAITLIVVSTSIVVHGISVTPLMRRYAHRQKKSARVLLYESIRARPSTFDAITHQMLRLPHRKLIKGSDFFNCYLIT